MDAVRWWATFLADELADCADVVYSALPVTSADDVTDVGAPAVVTVTPHRAGALALTVRAGGHDVPTVHFGDAAEVRCVGIPATATVAGLDPSNHLGVMTAALVSDGASLVQRAGRRRTLVLGPLSRHASLARGSIVQSWLPFAAEYGATTMFRRPPAYDELPRAAFVVAALPGWGGVRGRA